MANGFRIELGNVLPQSYNKPNVNQLKYQRVQHNKLDPNFKNLRPTVYLRNFGRTEVNSAFYR